MRRGQFYMIDAFFAAAILFLGISLLVTDYVASPDQLQAQTATADIVSTLYDTPISELSTEYISENYDILDESRTPAEQAHAWVFNATYGGCTWCLSNATALLESLVDDPLPAQHGLAILVNDTVIVNRTVEHEPSFRIVNTQLVFTEYNATLSIGPDPLEVWIWA